MTEDADGYTPKGRQRAQDKSIEHFMARVEAQRADQPDTAAIRADMDEPMSVLGYRRRLQHVCDALDEARAERDAARWYRGMLDDPNVLVQRDLARSVIREIEDQILDDPEAIGHGLFCNAHHADRGPCDCWAAKLGEIVEVYHRVAKDQP